MWFTEFGKPAAAADPRRRHLGQPPAASMNVRIPGGHPEGYLEAFATLYSQFAEVIRGDGKAFAGAAADASPTASKACEFITASVAVEQGRRQVDQAQRRLIARRAVSAAAGVYPSRLFATSEARRGR